MPANIEIKAHARNFERQRGIAAAIADEPVEVIQQHDIFFQQAKGRLKLRRFPSGEGELIAYERADQAGPKKSDYRIFRTDDPDGLQEVLTKAYGIQGEVIKTRLLYLKGQTRIHLDEVKDLGRFIELEVVLTPNQSEFEGVEIAQDIMRELEIQAGDLLESAYIDMLMDHSG